jgi:hypothetical protein
LLGQFRAGFRNWKLSRFGESNSLRFPLFIRLANVRWSVEIISNKIIAEKSSAGGIVKKIKVKNGMGGSRCGRGRTEKTATLKRLSKKGRREQGKKIIRAERGW